MKNLNEEDVKFLQEMIPHHLSAVKMALTVSEDGENSEIADLADGIISAQQAEIKQMRALLKKAGAKASPESGKPDKPDHGSMPKMRMR